MHIQNQDGKMMKTRFEDQMRIRTRNWSKTNSSSWKRITMKTLRQIVYVPKEYSYHRKRVWDKKYRKDKEIK